MDTVESTRIFVTGLPKSLNSTQLASHFSEQFKVTDAHVLPDRRIGFVGFSDHDTAQRAVKHFNRSYIRMSKITVDLAKPIEVNREADGQAVPVSNRGQHGKAEWQARDTLTGKQQKSTVPDLKSTAIDRKRKRDAQDDGEQARTESSPNVAQQNFSSTPAHTNLNNLEPDEARTDGDNEIVDETAAASDGDWLRGKTSRLLDLETPEDIVRGQEHIPDTHKQPEADVAPDEIVEHDQEGSLREPVSEPLVPNGRLFVRNIAFSVTEDDLSNQFGKFGKLQEVHIVVDTRTASSKGMAYVQFSEAQDAEDAMKAMDGVAFHGRLLHILTASDKRESGLSEYELSKMPLKKQKAIRRKIESNTASFSWNSLYMNPDAVISSIASRLGVSKSDILDPTSADAAVKQAHAETQIITETKQYLRTCGVQVDAFKNKTRDDRVILLKNFPFGTSEGDLRDLLGPYGQISRLIFPPTGTMAIAEFVESHSAIQALKGLAYKNIKGAVLYLEKAPRGLFATNSTDAKASNIATTSTVVRPPEDVKMDEGGITTTIFIRNLSFNTSSARLTELLSPLSGFLSAKVKTRTDPKRPKEILSMGFGFAEFKSPADANAAIAAVNGHRLDGHELIVKPSTKTSDLAEEQRRADNLKKTGASQTKIIIKNLPFQASKKDVRALFSKYGQLKNVRVPKKFDNTSRGFAFAEFVTAKEAASAIESLTDTHLLGRRLVLDFVEEETIDAEEQIKTTEKKIEQQSNRINLSKLTGTGRKKFNIGTAEDENY